MNADQNEIDRLAKERASQSSSSAADDIEAVSAEKAKQAVKPKNVMDKKSAEQVAEKVMDFAKVKVRWLDSRVAPSSW
ncbi:unnamed protein product, partial [marine sediment metagenome]